MTPLIAKIFASVLFWFWPQYVAVPFTAVGGSGTIIFVEAIGAVAASGSVTTASATITSTSAGDALFVGQVSPFPSVCSSATQSISDNQSETYTADSVRSLYSGGPCVILWRKLGTVSGVTTITVNGGSGNDGGGLLVLHFAFTGSWTGLDQLASVTGTSQSTPWASTGITTLYGTEVIIGQMYAFLHTYSSGIQNAVSFTGSWTGYGLCSQSSSAPCVTGSGGSLDGGGGGILGMGYEIVSTAQSGLEFTGTNNGSANVYYNYPGIASYH